MKLWRVGLAVLAAAAVVYASDPWDKAPSEWNERDVQRILENSPWVKIVTTKEELVQDASRGGNTQLGTRRMERGDMRATEFARVIWWSAHTPRRAFIRNVEMQGARIDENAAREFSETPMPDHIVVIESTGRMVHASARLEEAQLKQAAWLDLGRNTRVEPIEAAVVKDAAGKPERIRFHFPREWNGQPLLDQTRRVVFKWKLPNDEREKLESAKLREVAFDVRRMTAGGQADN